mmetsp:Transcript_17300/g.31156  ORF Transcript_17300/g.31156 Transcript_17300/m.31156 type:complete len:231 (+) Transcript_17300:2070-2762(+)
MWRLAAAALATSTAWCASSEEVFAKTVPALIQLKFFNKASLELDGEGTAFWISATGTALTSSALLKKFDGRKIVVVTQDGQELVAEGTLLSEVPGLGFIQCEASDLEYVRRNLSKGKVAAGDLLYVAGITGSEHIYFEQAILSNEDYPLEFPCDRIVGKIPQACIGGPVITEEGEVVGVVYERQLQMGLSYRLEHIKQVGLTKPKEWFFVRAWRTIREGLDKRFRDITRT